MAEVVLVFVLQWTCVNVLFGFSKARGKLGDVKSVSEAGFVEDGTEHSLCTWICWHALELEIQSWASLIFCTHQRLRAQRQELAWIQGNLSSELPSLQLVSRHRWAGCGRTWSIPFSWRLTADVVKANPGIWQKFTMIFWPVNFWEGSLKSGF